MTKLTEFDQLAELFSDGLNLYLNWAKQQGLSANEFYVLYYLSMAEQCTQKDISEEWQIPKQTVSVVCKNLVEKGWLKYSQATADKREKTLMLTKLGKSIALPMAEKLTAIEQQTAQEFGFERCAKLIGELKLLNQLFAKNLNQ